MSPFKSAAFFSICSAACVTLAIAQPASNVRPGLWEMSASSNLFALAEQIPPEQMQGLSNLAKQYGLVLPTIRNGAATSDVCITPEMAMQPIPPSFYHRQSGCEARNATRSENRLSSDLVCNGADVQGEGRIEATMDSRESFSGTTVFKGTVRGVPINDTAETTGRWIASDCTPAVRP